MAISYKVLYNCNKGSARMDEVKNPVFKPNKTVAVIGYALMNLLGGSFIIILIALMYASANKDLEYLSPAGTLAIIAGTNFETLTAPEIKLYTFSNSLGNMLTYLLMLGFVGFFMRDYLVEDAKGFKQNYKRLLWLIPVLAVGAWFISYGVDYIIELLVHDVSENQNAISSMILNGGAVYMFIAVVLCAPIVEELIYRKAIFEYLKNKHIAISYVISILLFTLPHMLTTFTNPLDWFLMSIPYAFSGFLLCFIYHFSGKNIYASWFAHMLNNLIAFILILVVV